MNLLDLSLPWRVEKGLHGSVMIIGADGGMLMLDNSRVAIIAEAMQYAVRATNAYEALKAACEAAQPIVCSSTCPSVRKEGEQWTHSDVCVALRAAIEKARGEP